MSLLARIARRDHAAAEAGKLLPIATKPHIVLDGGIPFVVSVVEKTAMKAKPRAKDAAALAPLDAFETVDPDLLVCGGDGAFPDHNIVLNKFPVVTGHLVIATREFHPQSEPLTPSDLLALWMVVESTDGLGFFNAGRIAGASQPRKHTQAIPRPRPPPGHPPHAFPIESAAEAALAEAAAAGASTARVAAFDFPHVLAPVPPAASAASAASPEAARSAAGDALCSLYGALLREVGACDSAYNLLLTRRWMMVVPRTRERWGPVSVNAVGFAGLLLARGDAGEALSEAGPLTALRTVAAGE
ncbi:hypothetical protein FNF27_03311 [Cafeteria roenbergensis]|uniref:Uncharacterized protein n=1 Tax=Cafeteria roenbergensis TaxID=33653 RepID=A0A5A8D4I1_CAFRO|nr:hypothetical protein FNF28_05699 [Cafeteria roenbergensis]KAA0175303.1 hypothetical protein FNF27_03311 [Cafeteria roenbergensis]